MAKKWKKLSFKIGIVFGILHLLIFTFFLLSEVYTPAYARGMEIAWAFAFLDFFLLPLTFYGFIENFWIELIIIYGILGTLCWFYAPILVGKIIKYFKELLAKKFI